MSQFDTMDKANRELFSFMWDEFDPASSLWRTTEVRQLRMMLAQVTLSSPVLDLGCGEGNIARVVFDGKKVDMVGLDDWPKVLRQAANMKLYRYAILGDARKLPFKKESFNVVFSNSVIEHIKDLDGVLEGAYRILKPKGLFIFTVPSDKFGDFLFFYRLFYSVRLKRLAGWYKDKRIDLLNHYNLFNIDQWQGKLNKFGFKIEYRHFYLSKTLLSAWDLTAAIGFILKKAKLNAVMKRLKKLFSPILLKILEREYYGGDLYADNSAALLVVVKKE